MSTPREYDSKECKVKMHTSNTSMGNYYNEQYINEQQNKSYNSNTGSCNDKAVEDKKNCLIF